MGAGGQVIVPPGTCEWCDRPATWAKETHGFSIGEFEGATFVRACDGHVKVLRQTDPDEKQIMRPIEEQHGAR
jgi:hypothetical protein